MNVLSSRRVLVGIGILLVLGLGLLWWRAQRALDPVPLRVGTDTTRITEPLRADGSVDYLAALNTEGFPPPESNAAIPLLRAHGTQCLVGDPAPVLKLLRAPPDLPQTGPFVELSEDVELPDAGVIPELDGPLRSWVEANREALDLLAAASRREHFRVPIVRDPSDGSLGAALPPWSLLDLATVLSARADLARADGHAEEAWADLMVLLRMHARLDGAQFLLARLIADSLGRMALNGIDGLLSDGAGSPRVIDTAIAELRALAPLRPFMDDVDRHERFFVLDILMNMVAAGEGAPWTSATASLDPNLTLQHANARFDQAVAEMRRGSKDTASRLRQVLERNRQAFREKNEELTSSWGRFRLFLMDAADRRDLGSRWAGDVLADLALTSVPSTLEALDEMRMRRRLTLLAMGLRLHAIRSGSFPQSLDALAPAILPALPDHPLTDLPFPYQLTESGCRLGGRNPEALLEEEYELTIELAR